MKPPQPFTLFSSVTEKRHVRQNAGRSNCAIKRCSKTYTRRCTTSCSPASPALFETGAAPRTSQRRPFKGLGKSERSSAASRRWAHGSTRLAATLRGHSWRQERTSRLDPVERLESPRYAEPDRLSAGLEQDELRARVRGALDRIPARYRRVLIDRYIDGRSIREIARRERVPVGTVGSRLFAARRMLREAWPDTAVRTAGRDMPEEKAQRIAEEALKRLTEELQTGRSDALKAYLSAMGRFHRYSWNNVILINSQRPTATRVAGFHTWHELGRSVKRGEKGIAILAPIRARQVEPTAPRDPDESGERITCRRFSHSLRVRR